MCGKRAAEVFCPCTSPETYLCANCVGPHMVKRGGRAHTAWPINQLPYYKIQGYAERVETRLEEFPQVRTQALEQVTLVDKAIEEFTGAIEKAIWDILQFAEKTKGELQALRTELISEIETALEEVERTLVEDQPRLTSRLGSVFRDLAEHLRPFQLFSYSLNISSALTVVTLTSQLHLSQAAVKSLPPKPAVRAAQPEESNLPPALPKAAGRNEAPQPAVRAAQPEESKLPPAPPHQTQLVCVKESTIEFYDFQTTTWAQPVPLTIQIQVVDSKWVFLEDGRVFCCGGRGMREAWMIGVGGKVELQPAMNGARFLHGLIAFVKVVYVFGGCNPAGLTTCEKLPLGTRQWRTLPNMNEARSFFNPCLFGHLIYLYGTSTTMEAFAPQTDTFLPPLTVPQQSILSSFGCCLYVHNDLLVVHQLDYIVKFAVEGGQLVKRSEVQCPAEYKEQNSQPVVAGGVVYMVFAGKCVRLDMETGAILA